MRDIHENLEVSVLQIASQGSIISRKPNSDVVFVIVGVVCARRICAPVSSPTHTQRLSLDSSRSFSSKLGNAA